MLISAIDIIIPIYVWLSFPWYLLTENLYIAINRGKSRWHYREIRLFLMYTVELISSDDKFIPFKRFFDQRILLA